MRGSAEPRDRAVMPAEAPAPATRAHPPSRLPSVSAPVTIAAVPGLLLLAALVRSSRIHGRPLTFFTSSDRRQRLRYPRTGEQSAAGRSYPRVLLHDAARLGRLLFWLAGMATRKRQRTPIAANDERGVDPVTIRLLARAFAACRTSSPLTSIALSMARHAMIRWSGRSSRSTGTSSGRCSCVGESPNH
jgi:hypothetical protein